MFGTQSKKFLRQFIDAVHVSVPLLGCSGHRKSKCQRRRVRQVAGQYHGFVRRLLALLRVPHPEESTSLEDAQHESRLQTKSAGGHSTVDRALEVSKLVEVCLRGLEVSPKVL